MKKLFAEVFFSAMMPFHNNFRNSTINGVSSYVSKGPVMSGSNAIQHVIADHGGEGGGRLISIWKTVVFLHKNCLRFDDK